MRRETRCEQDEDGLDGAVRPTVAILDFDGTLADSFACFLETIDIAADRHRFRRVQPDEVDHLRSLCSREIMKFLGVPLWKAPRVVADMRRLMFERVRTIRPFPGVPELLATLAAAGVELALVTSNTRAMVDAVLGPQSAALFARVDCGTSLFGKAAKLRAVLAALRREPRETLCIGDEIRDHEAAKSIGAGFRGVCWGYTRSDVLARFSDGPLFAAPEEIADLLAPRRHIVRISGGGGSARSGEASRG